MTITTTTHPDGIQIIGIKALAGILRGCRYSVAPRIYYQIIIPRAGGRLRIREHVDACSELLTDSDCVSLRYCYPRTMQQIADNIRDALDHADACDACR